MLDLSAQVNSHRPLKPATNTRFPVFSALAHSSKLKSMYLHAHRILQPHDQ